MQKATLVAALAALLALPAAVTAPGDVAIANITGPSSVDHLLIGIEEDNANCGGIAPADTSCSTGSHLRGGGGFFGPGSGENCPSAFNTQLPGYTGTLKMDIVYQIHNAGPGQVRTNTCNFSNGVVLSCIVTGVNPPTYPGAANGVATLLGVPVVTIYDHHCTSYNLGTTTPGGSGPWMCFSWHGLLT